jgi:hypothetical protein
MPREEHMRATQLEFVKKRLEKELEKLEGAPATPAFKKELGKALEDTLEMMTAITPRPRDEDEYANGKKVWDRGHKKFGVIVGTRYCQMEGCNGLRLITKWSNGRRTMPCTKGMRLKNGEWEIE